MRSARNNLSTQAITVDDVFKETYGLYDSLLSGPHPEINRPKTRLCQTHGSWFFAGGVLKRNVKGRHPLQIESNDAAREQNMILNPECRYGL